MKDRAKIVAALRRAGALREEALAKQEEARKLTRQHLEAARAADITWREIAELTHYTENRLQRIWAEREGQE